MWCSETKTQFIRIRKVWTRVLYIYNSIYVSMNHLNVSRMAGWIMQNAIKRSFDSKNLVFCWSYVNNSSHRCSPAWHILYIYLLICSKTSFWYPVDGQEHAYVVCLLRSVPRLHQPSPRPSQCCTHHNTVSDFLCSENCFILSMQLDSLAYAFIKNTTSVR